MQRPLVPALLLLLAVLLAGPSATDLHAGEGTRPAAERRGPRDPVELEAFLDGLMAAHLSEKKIAGAVVAVVRDGELLLAKGYGYSDLGSRAPVDPARTLFRIGSVSKLFTWIALMQQVERGSLDLDRDINAYLGFEVPATFPEPITPSHLLTHTSGFEERVTGLFSPSEAPRGEWLAGVMPARVRPPGRYSAYSNYGTALAGHIVEELTGLSWEEYIEREILEPLGMHQTTARQPLPAHLEAQMSVGYANVGDRLEPRDFELLLPFAPAGSISASAEDMARFMIANLRFGVYEGERILGEETARQMYSRAFSHDDRLNGFALGFYEKRSNGLRIIGHGGDTQWFHTDMALIHEEDLGIFVSYNTEAGGSLSFGTFLDLFLDHYYPEPRPLIALAAAGTELEPYAGVYRSNRSSYTAYEKFIGLVMPPVRVRVDSEVGELVLTGLGSEARYIALGDDLFGEVDGSGRLAFEWGEGGRVTHLFSSQMPMMALERLAWYDSPLLHQLLLGFAVLLFLSALVLQPARYLLERRFTELPRLNGWERLSRRVAMAVAILNLGTLVGLAVIFRSVTSILAGEVGGLGFVLLLPIVASLLTIGLIWFTVTAWRTGMWGIWGRLHYTIFTVSALIFTWVLSYWKLLGWHY